MSLHIDVQHRVGAFDLRADLVAERGLTVLFGPSGAGKSTLLSLIAGLSQPTAGRVVLHGRILTDRAQGIHIRPQERRIGMVFQDSVLLPHRTALANVALAVRAAQGGPRPDRRHRRGVAAEWLERVGVADLADRRPGQLSGGQQQRVALARALAGDPALLLLDEPFSSLDAAVRARLGALVRTLVDEAGLTAVFVTHDRSELRTLADRVALAGPGAITGVVSPEIALRRVPAEDDDAQADDAEDDDAGDD